MPRTVLITGASGGLGVPVTRTFRDAGYRVVTAALDGGVKADLSTPEGVRSAVDAAGKPAILLHLMGAFQPGSSEEIWDKMISVNLRSTVRLIEAVLPAMRESQWGRILTIGAQAGETRPAGLEAYAASKAAVHALIQSTAASLKGSGVTANAILPSTIDTAATRAAMPDADRSGWVQPADIAAMLLLLCSDNGSSINGALIRMGT